MIELIAPTIVVANFGLRAHEGKIRGKSAVRHAAHRHAGFLFTPIALGFAYCYELVTCKDQLIKVH